LRPRPEHEALAAARARLESEAGRRLSAQRQGVESTLSQGVRAFGLRQARYRGLAKTGLQNVATAAALNLDRLAAWLAQRPLAPTRLSRFAALMAWALRQRCLIDYGQRYRAGKPISTSRAEGTVNQLVNARMNKRRQMRWSPRGAHRVLQVRAAVLDGRFGQQAIQLAA
jgi:DDE family transposase